MIAKGGKGWVGSVLLVSAFFFILSLYWLSFLFLFIPFLCISIFFLIFFRDPERTIGSGIVAPADGKIRDIQQDNKTCFVSIFMEVNNVHVNRMPLDGIIKKMTHFPGYHFRAWKKESDYNERVELEIDSSIGTVKVVQIAGLIARRIYPYITKGDTLKKGDRIGIIRLGSRVDVYLPSSKVHITVKVGDKVLAGQDTIAELKKIK